MARSYPRFTANGELLEIADMITSINNKTIFVPAHSAVLKEFVDLCYDLVQHVPTQPYSEDFFTRKLFPTGTEVPLQQADEPPSSDSKRTDTSSAITPPSPTSHMAGDGGVHSQPAAAVIPQASSVPQLAAAPAPFVHHDAAAWRSSVYFQHGLLSREKLALLSCLIYLGSAACTRSQSTAARWQSLLSLNKTALSTPAQLGARSSSVPVVDEKVADIASGSASSLQTDPAVVDDSKESKQAVPPLKSADVIHALRGTGYFHELMDSDPAFKRSKVQHVSFVDTVFRLGHACQLLLQLGTQAADLPPRARCGDHQVSLGSSIDRVSSCSQALQPHQLIVLM